ncbi:hypothetical protein K0M31_012057 [Melipona bicolor]|uniref:Uncharacterized protein n=1 Tax=Melipona bicolor TaxID=60889 RepID=A0AA40GBI0_9HYME|nr:hypothetical protein K0M31_012057 [Melipona bicolor]
MADDESSSTSDESLDVKSVKFDPMKALYSRKIDLSVTKAPIYDNVSKFEAVMSGLSGQMKVRIALARADATHHHTADTFSFSSSLTISEERADDCREARRMFETTIFTPSR